MSLRQQLKTATQPYHDQTEQLSGPSAQFTLDDYRRFLLTGWLFHGSLEKSLTAFLPDWLKADLQWANRLKTPRITQDLQELGVDAAAFSMLPFVVHTIPEAWGALYVAEGSTLGGMMMKKMWENHPVIGKHSSFHFLGCYGQKTGAYWKLFLAVLESNTFGSTDEADTIASAQATFEFYQTCHRQVVAAQASTAF
jgi:heme oxygenase